MGWSVGMKGRETLGDKETTLTHGNEDSYGQGPAIETIDSANNKILGKEGQMAIYERKAAETH